jgi:hypothetical protein
VEAEDDEKEDAVVVTIKSVTLLRTSWTSIDVYNLWKTTSRSS